MEGPQPYYTHGRLASMLLLIAALVFLTSLRSELGIALFFFLPILVVVLCVILGAAYFLHEARRARRASAREAAGLCVKCGYDLRESAGDLCPECAMPIWRRRDPITGKVLSPSDNSSRRV